MTPPILLPPLPEPVGKVLYAGPYHHTRQTEGAFDADQLRARDLEVARLVLEAAAQAAQPDDPYQQDSWFRAKVDAVNCILALEIKHHE
jgi:hypothetical protein